MVSQDKPAPIKKVNPSLVKKGRIVRKLPFKFHGREAASGAIHAPAPMPSLCRRKEGNGQRGLSLEEICLF